MNEETPSDLASRPEQIFEPLQWLSPIDTLTRIFPARKMEVRCAMCNVGMTVGETNRDYSEVHSTIIPYIVTTTSTTTSTTYDLFMDPALDFHASTSLCSCFFPTNQFYHLNLNTAVCCTLYGQCSNAAM